MFVVDTNILVYAADEDSPFHARCFEVLEEWRSQASAWYSTWGIMYELLRVTTHLRIFRTPWSASRAWNCIEAVLASPSLGILIPTERHAEVIADVMKEIPHLSGNLMCDLQTAVLMREHGIKRIYTRDTDFYRFHFLEPIDPVA
jgi:hypothetical protein